MSTVASFFEERLAIGGCLESFLIQIHSFIDKSFCGEVVVALRIKFFTFYETYQFITDITWSYRALSSEGRVQCT
jgi:hypothetical protein